MSSPENHKPPVKRNSSSKLSKCSNEALTGSEENKTKKERNTRDIEAISQINSISPTLDSTNVHETSVQHVTNTTEEHESFRDTASTNESSDTFDKWLASRNLILDIQTAEEKVIQNKEFDFRVILCPEYYMHGFKFSI
ncbi:Hypothetical predicted protein [Paramuricea clavata]|uniref:Uncharacterized protein n=1 Tax=Paramuricea clavata TaxID=317549 RepID=A0A7D9IFH8_PARCT|nr:Hypothetical predicted protein [Paramuricea clavata]